MSKPVKFEVWRHVAGAGLWVMVSRHCNRLRALRIARAMNQARPLEGRELFTVRKARG